MTSLWQRLEIMRKVCEVLGDVPATQPEGHHLGRPYVTAYQLAIGLDAQHPEVGRALGVEIGGAGIGRHNSLAQYLARELSRQIALDGGTAPVEGAFLSHIHITALTFINADGGHHTSSLTESGFPLSMFRLRVI
ncbi:hypothetical protein [Amycolatopsis sp. lyj-112]|uniref:hypothetical protein n=1 Tax=Amycolatopsis sp. lyj-112 TaxID=2789288 RepID=UPI0039798294